MLSWDSSWEPGMTERYGDDGMLIFFDRVDTSSFFLSYYCLLPTAHSLS